MKKTAFVPFIGCLCWFNFIACSKQQVVPVNANGNAAESSQVSRHYVGETFGGGIVFLIDSTGKHGMIAANVDFEEAFRWANKKNSVTNTFSVKIGSGRRNTANIVSVFGDNGEYAAFECSEFSVDGNDDWFLPSQNELNQLYKQKDIVGGFSPFAYWSSSESGLDSAWYQNFSNGLQYKAAKIAAYAVRPVRYF